MWTTGLEKIWEQRNFIHVRLLVAASNYLSDFLLTRHGRLTTDLNGYFDFCASRCILTSPYCKDLREFLK
jgi:hypothetical protein